MKMITNPIQLPISKFKLRIISLSFNRSDTHQLLSSTYNHSTISLSHQSLHFKLLSIHQSIVQTHKNPIINPNLKSLSSCFSSQDQLLWKKKRSIKNNNPFRKPIFDLRLSFSLRIKDTHKSAVVRKNLRKKWIAALKLIVQYGAHHIDQEQDSLPSSAAGLLSINQELAKPEDWLLKDYYYIVHPYLSLHQLTVPQLVPFLQQALKSIIIQSNSTPHLTNLQKHSSNRSIHQRHSQFKPPLVKSLLTRKPILKS